MKKKYLMVLIAASFLILLLAWSPWITKEYAEEKVLNEFNEKWKNVSDGCGFNCPNCGVFRSDKTVFGYEVILLYDCGMKAVTMPPEWQDKMFVSYLGTVHTISHQTNLD